MDDRHRADVEAYRREREDAFRREDGWLAQVDLAWLEGGVAELDVGRFTCVDDDERGRGVRFVASADRDVRLDGEPVRDVVLPDVVDDGREILASGSRRYQLVRRGGALAVRVRDVDAPLRRAFRGLSWYPVDPAWRVVARLDRSSAVRSTMRFTSGQEEELEVPGVLLFSLGGSSHRLVPYARPDGSLLVVFRDATNADETCALCRYFHAPPPDDRDEVVLDFNLAAAPICALVPFVTCVLPPPENSLLFRVTAGELRYEVDS